MSDFDNKRIIVTGAGKGIGRQLALALTKKGATVIAISRTEADLASLKKEDPRFETYCQDITKWDETRALLTSIGPVHMLVNNAGNNIPAGSLEATQEQFDKILDVNLKAAFNVTQVVTGQMVANGIEGSVVNLSSIAAGDAFKDALVYSMSKAALDMMTKCFVFELGSKGIRVNSVRPTVVLTDMGKLWLDSEPGRKNSFLQTIPSGRLPEVQDVLDTIIFLLGSNARMINGAILPVDGGQTVQRMPSGK